MKYVMVLLVPFYRVDDEVIACESAFAAHLKELLPRISEWGTDIVVHSPTMSRDAYEANKDHLTHMHSAQEHIYYVESFPVEHPRWSFSLKAPFTIWPKIWKVVKSANVVHASASKDIFRLFTFMAILFAAIQKKKSIFVMDIDHRHSAKMSYLTGEFSRKSYWLSRYIYMPAISMQIRFAVKYCYLLMLKGQALVDDYGKGKPHVKNFYNTVHNESIVITEDECAEKIRAVNSSKESIRLVYFGRVVDYKGIPDMIEATSQLADTLSNNTKENSKAVSLTIIGAGTAKPSLQKLVRDKGLEQLVEFKDPISYGPLLFDELKQYDFLLAAPHSEDTPRSVFDAMACGLPIVAYDTYYYKDLESTGAVTTVPWLSPDAMAQKILSLSENVEQWQQLISCGRAFALNNTQQIWMDKRLRWTREFLSSSTR